MFKNYLKKQEIKKVEANGTPVEIKVDLSSIKTQVIRVVEKIIKFPDLQKVEVTNFPEIKTEKIEIKESKIEFPDIQKTKVINAQELPVGKKNIPGIADPEKYLVVRITDGEHFVRPTDKIASGGGGGVGSTIGNRIITNQITMTGSALALAQDTRIMNGVIVRAMSGNAQNVYVGNSAVSNANGFELTPGESTSMAINNLADVYVIGTAADKICFITTN